MTKDEFLQAYASARMPQWEAGALAEARAGNAVAWPMVEVPLSVPSSGPLAALAGKASVHVASDVFAVGTQADPLRLPLTPETAQSIADLGGFVLPTRKIANDIWKAASIKLQPYPTHLWGQKNLGANLNQYDGHNTVIQGQLSSMGKAGTGELVTGHKKDVVLSNEMMPGHVSIYGWFNQDGSRIQPLTSIHSDQYVDYSHGIRFVAPFMTIDGQTYRTADVMVDPNYAGLVSDEGALKTTRYPTSVLAADVALIENTAKGFTLKDAIASLWGWTEFFALKRKA